MRLLPPLLLAVAAALSGCAGATRTVDLGADLGDVNRRLAGEPTMVVLGDGAAYPADAIRIAPDSTFWVDPATGQFVAVPTADISVIERRDRKRASHRLMGRGILVGAASGAVLGGIAGNEFSECFITCSEPTPGERTRGIVVFGAAGALGGALYGAFVGAVTSIVSSPTEWFVIEPAPSPPPAGGAGEAQPNGAPAPNRAP